VRGQESLSSGRTTPPGGGVLPPWTTRQPNMVMNWSSLQGVQQDAPMLREAAADLMGENYPTWMPALGKLC
jgi:hypothetical protein